MVRRAPRVPVPEWAAPYDAEASRLDALLRDMADEEWLAPVLLRWFDGRRQTERETTVAGVIAHLLAVDGLVAAALGLPDPLDSGRDAAADDEQAETPGPPNTAATTAGPTARTEEFWRADLDVLRTPRTREHWREQGHAMVRTASFAGRGVAELEVPYGGFTLPVRDALLDRAFECWVHAEDIAEAIDYPYEHAAGRSPAPHGRPGRADAARLDRLAPPRRTRLTAGAARSRRRTGARAPSGGRGRRRRRLVHPAGLSRRESPARPTRWPMWRWTATSSASSPPVTCRRWRPRPDRTATGRPSATCCSRPRRSPGCSRPGRSRGSRRTVRTPRRQVKTTVLCPLSSTRCSLCHFTARASAWHSTSRPTATSWAGDASCPTRSTSCSMIGPSSSSAVT